MSEIVECLPPSFCDQLILKNLEETLRVYESDLEMLG
jgi:hypothetical protein